MTRNKTATLIVSAFFAAVTFFSTLGSAVAQTKSGTFYDIKISTMTKDGKTTATVTVTGSSGYKPNKDYPWKLTVLSGPGISEKKTLRKDDAKQFDSTAVVFEVTTDESHDQKVSAELKLGMCDAKQCKMEKVPLTWPQ